MSAYRAYWNAYGGWRALILSPYLWGGGVFWALCKPIWFDGRDEGYPWSEWALSLLSGLIAFSLGALAIFLAFSNDKFVALIRQGGNPKSYFISVVAAFFHFIIVQFFAIASIILLISYKTEFISGLAFFLFCYAMSCGIAAAAALVDTADILNRLGELDGEGDSE